MLIAAFRSRSWRMPQTGQFHSRTESGKSGVVTRKRTDVGEACDNGVGVCWLQAGVSSSLQTQQLISNWLQDMGLELKPSKTRITHTLHPHEGNLGFDFLGFHVRQFQVGKTHSGKNPQGEILGFKTIIRPSDEAI